MCHTIGNGATQLCRLGTPVFRHSGACVRGEAGSQTNLPYGDPQDGGRDGSRKPLWGEGPSRGRTLRRVIASTR